MPRDHKWFPGYNVAAVATLAYVATAPGQTFVLSLINGTLRETFGISELTLNASYTIATIVASLPLTLMGSLTDRVGPGRMLALVALLFGAACLVMSGASNFVMVVLAFFLLRFLGQGSLAMVSQHAVAMWFHKRLGTINGIKQVVVFGVWIIFPQVAAYLIEAFGWRWTYAILALFIWVAVIPAALLLVRDKPEDLGLRLDGDSSVEESDRGVAADTTASTWSPEPEFTLKQAMRTRAYWALVLVMIAPPLIGTAFLFDIQPILKQHGMDDISAGANAVSAWAATMAILAIPSGWLTDRVRASVALSLGILFVAMSVLAFWSARTPMAAALAMVIFGTGQSLVKSCSGATLARYFGRSGHGAIRSSVMRLGVIATGVGPLITALSFYMTGSYSAAMVVFLILCVPAFVLGVSLRQPTRAD